MSRVVLLAHDGVHCALPAVQVLRADLRERLVDTTLALFRSIAEVRKEEDPRLLLVRTSLGDRWMECSDARFDWLDGKKILELPALLREILALPHVVGLAEVRDWGLVWLVDLDRWSVERPAEK